MPLRKKKNNKSTGLMVLAGETAKMAQNLMVLDKTEAALEKELEKEEKRPKPITKIAKIRRKGEHVIHGKYLLLMVVILNVIDCLLVLGELILDIKYVTDLLTKEYERSEEFIGSMKGLYPHRLGYLGSEDIEALEHEILTANLTWDTNGNHGYDESQGHSDIYSTTIKTVSSTALSYLFRKRRASVEHDTTINSNHSDSSHGQHVGHHHAHSIEEEIAHGLHKASITILGILVCETLFKIFCFGKAMLEHKLECFDGVIVIASFIVDLVFIKGLQKFTVQEFVLVLAFMVPWRVIRVVNSLVVAIMDHEHLRLVLLYKQKKKISQELKEAKDENKGLEACIDALQKLCTGAGLPDTLVTAKLNMYRKVKAKSNALGAMSSFAIGGDAMSKPFVNRDISPSNAALVDETKANQAKQLEDVISDKATVAELTENTIEITNTLVSDEFGPELWERRQRSILAIEPITSRKDSDVMEELAENSASFIATMNADETDLRRRIEDLSKRQSAKQTQPKDTEISKTSTTDFTDDTDGTMKGNNDDDKDDGGSDTPTSRLL